MVALVLPLMPLPNPQQKTATSPHAKQRVKGSCSTKCFGTCPPKHSESLSCRAAGDRDAFTLALALPKSNIYIYI